MKVEARAWMEGQEVYHGFFRNFYFLAFWMKDNYGAYDEVHAKLVKEGKGNELSGKGDPGAGKLHG